MSNVHAVVLAAGKSSRFIGPWSKLLTPLNGQEMVLYSLKLLEQLKLPKTFVLGHQHELIQPLLAKHSSLPELYFALQTLQLGTGHALACSRDSWTKPNILVLNGDMPLLQAKLVQQLIAKHNQTQAVVSFVTFNASNPINYGRVFVNHNNVRIVEHRDCNAQQLTCKQVNAGVYLFAREFLEQNLEKLDYNNAAKELYLTDLISIASKAKHQIVTLLGPENQLLGINTNAELAAAVKLLKRLATQNTLCKPKFS